MASDAPGRPASVTDRHGVTYLAGAPGIGDPYFADYGNSGYDVTHYRLALRYTPQSGQLDGDATLSAAATANLYAFDLDLGPLAVRSVTVDGAAAAWVRAGARELVVTAPRRLRDGQPFTVEVRYRGVPHGAGSPNDPEGFLRTRDGGAVVAGEPESATDWYPSNDHPRDKATYEFAVTVPDGFAVVANGVPDGVPDRSGAADPGWTTWRWAEHAPMATYLATVAIGRFRLLTGTSDGIAVYTAVAASLPADRIDPAVARTPEIVRFLSTRFGPYPFEAMGAIVPDIGLAFSLETQTRPVYAPGAFRADNPDDRTSVVAHELAHQWYGDSVSVHDWRDIWLNEGFATYAQWLWDEHLGRRTVAQDFDRAYGQPASWTPPPGDPGAAHLFAPSVYQRGAMTLQALRLAVGDATFFAILRGWAVARRYGNGSTAQFVAFASRTAGRPLDTLLHTWLYADTKPPHP